MFEGMRNPPRPLRSDDLTARLPCGGEIWITFISGFFPASSKGKVCVSAFPHVKCPDTYSDGKGCPWLDRFRKLHTAARGVEEAAGYGDWIPPKAKPYDERDRVVREMSDGHARGFAVTPDGMIYDRLLRPMMFDEPEDTFCNCPRVESDGGNRSGIRGFIRRLFGRKTKTGGTRQ